VKFENEEAEDAGGVTKEFFSVLSREILNPNLQLFQHYEETRTIWFNDDSFENSISMMDTIGESYHVIRYWRLIIFENLCRFFCWR
jgi:hypothetical protein